MAVAYRSSTSANTGASAAASLAVTTPASIQIHDVLIATIVVDGNTGTISTPAGWTLLRTATSAGAVMRMSSFWRLVDGTEAANYTWTFDTTRQASGAILAYSGASITVPPSANNGSTTVAGTSFAGTSTNSSYESGMSLQFFSSRNTTGASTQTAGGTYAKREDTCTTASTFIGLAGQDAAKGLTVGGTAATGNTCTVASTSIVMALFIDEARPAYNGLAVDEYSVGSFTTSASSMTLVSTQTNVPNVTLFAWISINKDVATVSSIATTGLTWSLVARSNTNAGSVELWRAFAANPISTTSTVVTLSASVVSANAMICGFIGAEYTTGYGAIATSGITAAAATTSLATTKNNSWVWAAMNSSTTATSPTAGSAQTVIRSQTDTTNTAQSVMWRVNSRTAVTGTSVTTNVTVPATPTGNILAVEIIPAQSVTSMSALGIG